MNLNLICSLYLFAGILLIVGFFLLPCFLSKHKLIDFIDKVGFMGKEFKFSDMRNLSYIEALQDDDIIFAIQNADKIDLTEEEYILFLLEKEYRGIKHGRHI